MTSNRDDIERILVEAKEEETQHFEEEAFVSLLRDDKNFFFGYDLDEAIAETDGLRRPNSADDGASGMNEELLMRLEMEGEEPVSDAEGDENEDDEEWPPKDPNNDNSKQAKLEELTRSVLARVERMSRRDEEQEQRGKTAVTVTSLRVRNGQSFNIGGWSSEELKELYDGIKKFGTSKEALARLLNHSEHMVKKRSLQDLYDKIEDIRAMNKEHKEELIIQDKVYAHQRGTLRFQEMGKLAFIWSQQMQKLQNSRAFSRKHELIRIQLTNFFTQRVRESTGIAQIDGVTIGPSRPIRWSRLYRIARFIFASNHRVRDLPTRIGINAMEAAVLMLIMNDIQKQARAKLTERMRAENGSLFIALAHQSYHLFNLDEPVSNFGKPFLDPLRLREWRAVETGEAPEEEETYEQMFHSEDSHVSRAKKRVRMEEETFEPYEVYEETTHIYSEPNDEPGPSTAKRIPVNDAEALLLQLDCKRSFHDD